jgi:transcriptional regulator with XRE-family HTH domain
MDLNQVFRGDGQAVSTPVFDGLETLGFSGLDIAEIACVSPPTISKWRNGYTFAPNEFIVLLTLILASCLLDVLDQGDYGNMPTQVHALNQRPNLESARGDLEAQEKINYNLPPSAVRAGAIRFRYWWHTQQRLK